MASRGRVTIVERSLVPPEGLDGEAMMQIVPIADLLDFGGRGILLSLGDIASVFYYTRCRVSRSSTQPTIVTVHLRCYFPRRTKPNSAAYANARVAICRKLVIQAARYCSKIDSSTSALIFTSLSVTSAAFSPLSIEMIEKAIFTPEMSR